MNQLEDNGALEENRIKGTTFLTSFLGKFVMEANWTHHGPIDWTETQKVAGALPTNNQELGAFIAKVAKHQETYGYGQIELQLMLDAITRGLNDTSRSIQDEAAKQIRSVMGAQEFSSLHVDTRTRIQTVFEKHMPLVRIAHPRSVDPSARSHGIELVHLRFSEI